MWRRPGRGRGAVRCGENLGGFRMGGCWGGFWGGRGFCRWWGLRGERVEGEGSGAEYGVHLSRGLPVGMVLRAMGELKGRGGAGAVLIMAEESAAGRGGYREHLHLDGERRLVGIRRKFWKHGEHRQRGRGGGSGLARGGVWGGRGSRWRVSRGPRRRGRRALEKGRVKGFLGAGLGGGVGGRFGRCWSGVGIRAGSWFGRLLCRRGRWGIFGGSCWGI